jgi:hypothetical protein
MYGALIGHKQSSEMVSVDSAGDCFPERVSVKQKCFDYELPVVEFADTLVQNADVQK